MIIVNIIIKDLKTILSDKKALAIIIFMPLILMTILSFALKGSFFSGEETGIDRVNAAVVKLYNKDEDLRMFKTSLDRELLAEAYIDTGDDVDPETIFFEDFLGSDDVSGIISYRTEEKNDAMDLLNKGEISAIIFLPEKYIYDMKINLLTPFRNKIDINILTHPDRSIDGFIVKSVINSYTKAMSSVIIGKNTLIETAVANGLGSGSFSNMDDVMGGMAQLAEGIDINIENFTVEGKKSITSADYYAVAMMTMFILFAAGMGGRMILEEKDNQTYQRMIIAGTSKFGILLGKFITIFLIAIIQIFVMILFSHYALKVQWANISAVILISLTSAFAVAGLGAFIAAATSRTGNYKMANIFENVIIQVMALFGGSFFPIDVMPEVLQRFTILSLNGIALKAYLKVLAGYGTEEIMVSIFILAGIGLVFSISAAVTLMGKEGSAHVKHNKIKAAKA